MSDRILCHELDCAKQISFVKNGSGKVHVSVVNGMAAYGPHLPSDLVEDVGDSKVAAKSLDSSSGVDASSAGDGEGRGEVKVADSGDVLESDDKDEKSVATKAGSYVYDDRDNEKMSADERAARVDSLAFGSAPSNVSIIQLGPEPVASAVASAAPAPAQLTGTSVASAPSAVVNVQPEPADSATLQVGPAATDPVVAMLGQVLDRTEAQGLPAQVSDESSSMPTRGDVRRRYGDVDNSNEAASIVLDFEHEPIKSLHRVVLKIQHNTCRLITIINISITTTYITPSGHRRTLVRYLSRQTLSLSPIKNLTKHCNYWISSGRSNL
jgi:hypothetical protein